MQIILQSGDHLPEVVVTKGGQIIREFRAYTMSDGRLVLDCGDCNMLASPRGTNINLPADWVVDAEGVLVYGGAA